MLKGAATGSPNSRNAISELWRKQGRKSDS